MVDVNEPMISDKDRKASADQILPIASISSTNPQITVTHQSTPPRSSPPTLLENFNNGTTK